MMIKSNQRKLADKMVQVKRQESTRVRDDEMPQILIGMQGVVSQNKRLSRNVKLELNPNQSKPIIDQYCAIQVKSSAIDSIIKHHSSSNCVQTMYNSNIEPNRRCTNHKLTHHNKSRHSISNHERLFSGPWLIRSIVTLVLASSILIVQTHAAPSAPEVSPTGQDSKQQPTIDRSESTSSPDSSTSQKSIVASLSSAVASVAAAAAAQSSLSGSDARSLLSGSQSGSHSVLNSHHHNHNHAQHSRSQGLNLAIKIADAIPEVPYNILHNMKKLDHAAPFYNVHNKLSGSTKESSPSSLLVSALGGSGNLGSAAEQLSALFKSPLWKRIADGYGEFTSEFRSLFRAQAPSPMKGSANPTSKFLREISVPALIMLLASTISSDWRPVRTRRKSFSPVDIQNSNTNIEQYAAQQPSFSIQPVLRSLPMYNSNMNALNSPLDHTPANRLWQANNDNQQMVDSNQQPTRVADIGFQPSESAVLGSWLSAQQPTSGQNHHQLGAQPAISQPQHQIQYIKRSGDSVPSTSDNESSNKYQQGVKPVKSDADQLRSGLVSAQPGSLGLFSSLTSTLAKSKLMERVINANLANDGNSYGMVSLNDGQKMSSSIKRDQLNDKQRYTLVGLDDNDFAHFSNTNEQKLSPSSKPFLISAMSHALNSMFYPQQVESGSSVGNIGDKTINHKDSILRRQHQTGTGVEQRDLSQLLPQSWRDVVKRTVNNVQQQATTQWKSIEGQVTNWVQDKLKTFPATSSAGTSSGSTANGSSQAGSAPMANIIATVSSTAMNMLGFGNKNASHSASNLITPSSQSDSSHKAHQSNGPSTSESTNNQRGKTDNQIHQQPSKGAFAVVADLIVNKLTNRLQSATPSSSSSLSSSSTNSNAQKYPTLGDDKMVSPPISSTPISLSVSVTSQYPTLTGAQPPSTTTSHVQSSSPPSGSPSSLPPA